MTSLDKVKADVAWGAFAVALSQNKALENREKVIAKKWNDFNAKKQPKGKE